MGGIGQDNKAIRIRYQANFAYRPHAFDRLQLVEHVHGLHGYGKANAAFETRSQVINVGQLAADGTTIVAIEETNQSDFSRLGGGYYFLLRIHSNLFLSCRWECGL